MENNVYNIIMIKNFIQLALRKAKYERLEDGSYCGTIAGFRGVLAGAKTLSGCKKELAEVLEEWMLVKISRGQNIPGFIFKPRTTEYA